MSFNTILKKIQELEAKKKFYLTFGVSLILSFTNQILIDKSVFHPIVSTISVMFFIASLYYLVIAIFLKIKSFFVKPTQEVFKYSLYSKVVGVTFNNDDGSSRQNNIRKYLSEGDELAANAYSYKGEPAIGIYANKKYQIGNLSSDLAYALNNVPDGTRVKFIVKNITGGTKEKKMLGVNIDIFTTNKI